MNKGTPGTGVTPELQQTITNTAAAVETQGQAIELIETKKAEIQQKDGSTITTISGIHIGANPSEAAGKMFIPSMKKGEVLSIVSTSETGAVVLLKHIPDNEGYRGSISTTSNFQAGTVLSDNMVIPQSTGDFNFTIVALDPDKDYWFLYAPYKADLANLATPYKFPKSNAKAFKTKAVESDPVVVVTPHTKIAAIPPKIWYSFDATSGTTEVNKGSLGTEANLTYHTSGITNGGSMMATQPSDKSKIFDGVKTSAGGFAQVLLASAITLHDSTTNPGTLINPCGAFLWTFKSLAVSRTPNDDFLFSFDNPDGDGYITFKHDESLNGQIKIEREKNTNNVDIMARLTPPQSSGRTSFFDGGNNCIISAWNETQKWFIFNAQNITSQSFGFVMAPTTLKRINIGTGRGATNNANKSQLQITEFVKWWGPASEVPNLQGLIDISNQIIAAS